MGLDLTICPHDMFYEGMKLGGPWVAHTRIDLSRHYDLFSLIAPLDEKKPPLCSPKPLPSDVSFYWYQDEGVKVRKVDPYGDALQYVKAGELAKLARKIKTSDWNKAVLQMMKNIHPDTPVVLWWH